MDRPGTLPGRWRTLAAAWDPSEGRRGDVARAAIFRLCAEELEASIAGDSLAEELESERLRAALRQASAYFTEGDCAEATPPKDGSREDLPLRCRKKNCRHCQTARAVEAALAAPTSDPKETP